jgi:hypothetical protein
MVKLECITKNISNLNQKKRIPPQNNGFEAFVLGRNMAIKGLGL